MAIDNQNHLHFYKILKCGRQIDLCIWHYGRSWSLASDPDRKRFFLTKAYESNIPFYSTSNGLKSTI